MAPKTALQAVASLWHDSQLPKSALAGLQLAGVDPVFSSSFAVGAAAQASLAAAALAACELAWPSQSALGSQRVCEGPASAAVSVDIDMLHAAIECTGHFAIDGRVPDLWDAYSGLYRCKDGWVRIHANFAHHREGALALLGLVPGEAVGKGEVERALSTWTAEEFEAAAAARGCVVAALRTREQWLAHPQAAFVRAEPLVGFEAIAGHKPQFETEIEFKNAIKNIANNAVDVGQSAKIEVFPHFLDRLRPFASSQAANKPLAGLRVLELTRILAGPLCGRTLAAYGADVLLINSPDLPNIEAIADTSRGKRSAHLDLKTEAGRAQLRTLVSECDVFVQGYRPGSLERLGFGPEALAALRPGLVVVSLAAYGFSGPWAGRRGFDSLVQTATGFNADESLAAGIDYGAPGPSIDGHASGSPRALPMQMLDCATGYLMAFGALAALLRMKANDGADPEIGMGTGTGSGTAAGSRAALDRQKANDASRLPRQAMHVKLSLARTGEWLRDLGRLPAPACFSVAKPSPDPFLTEEASGFGHLAAVRHAVQLNGQACAWTLPSMPPGSHPAAWW